MQDQHYDGPEAAGEIGQFLRGLREGQDLTRAQVSEMTGINSETIRKYEGGCGINGLVNFFHMVWAYGREVRTRPRNGT